MGALRDRMVRDMQLRRLSPRTQYAYKQWTIARAKKCCDGLQVKRETGIAPPLDDLIKDLATSQRKSDYIQAIKWVRGQNSHWGLKEAKVYVHLLCSDVH